MQNFTVPADFTALSARLNRKFEVQDVAEYGWLRGIAADFADSWVFDHKHWANTFMHDMQTRIERRQKLSDGQYKGILNVLRAVSLPAAPAAPASAPALNVADIESARYTVVTSAGERISVRLNHPSTWTDEKESRKVSVKVSGAWSGVGKVDADGTVRFWRKAGGLADRARIALRVLLAAEDRIALGKAYALEANECFFCGKELDTPDSIAAGYGPDCARRRNLPWGGRPTAPPVILNGVGAGQAALGGYDCTECGRTIEPRIAAYHVATFHPEPRATSAFGW